MRTFFVTYTAVANAVKIAEIQNILNFLITASCADLHNESTDSQDSSKSSSQSNMLTPMLHNFLEVSASPPLAALHSMTEMKSNSGSGNPHGIDHILARPTGLHRTFNSVTAANMAAAAGMAASYFHHNGGKHSAHSLSDFTSRSPIYWPGFQGLVSNPMAWRDRLANSKFQFCRF